MIDRGPFLSSRGCYYYLQNINRVDEGGKSNGHCPSHNTTQFVVLNDVWVCSECAQLRQGVLFR